MQHGANELATGHRASPIQLFFGQFKNTLIVILLVATVLSALLGEIVDAAIISVIVVFCAVLGFVQEYRADRALDALKTHAGARRSPCCGRASSSAYRPANSFPATSCCWRPATACRRTRD